MDFDLDDAGREEARTLAAVRFAPGAASRDRESRFAEGWPALLQEFGLGDAGLVRARAPALAARLSGLAEGSGDASLVASIASHVSAVGAVVAGGGRASARVRLSESPIGAGVLAGDLDLHARDPASVRATARGKGFRLSGTRCRVVNGGVARAFVVPVSVEGVLRLAFVPRDAGGLSTVPAQVAGLRGAALADVSFDDTEIGAESVLEGEPTAAVAEARRWHRLATGAGIAGLLRALFQRVVFEARETQELGRPLAANQLVRNVVADLRIRDGLACRFVARAAFRFARDGSSADETLAAARLYVQQALTAALDDATAAAGPAFATPGHLHERLLRDARALEATDLPIRLQRSTLAFSSLRIA